MSDKTKKFMKSGTMKKVYLFCLLFMLGLYVNAAASGLQESHARLEMVNHKLTMQLELPMMLTAAVGQYQQEYAATGAGTWLEQVQDYVRHSLRLYDHGELLAAEAIYQFEPDHAGHTKLQIIWPVNDMRGLLLDNRLLFNPDYALDFVMRVIRA